jgi:SAM-dependent methyltransferase
MHDPEATSEEPSPEVGWDAAAGGWERRRDRMWEASHAVGEGLVEMAAPAPGESVLEIAAGPGDTGFLAAELVGERGRLVSTDLSTRMLAAAERRAADLGLRNVEFRQVDAQAMDLESGSFDVALCRWGLMLMPDPAAALAEMRRVLRPGGRLALAVWGPREANPWNTTIQGAFGDHGLLPPQPGPSEPGMFRLADRGELTALVAAAGFADVQLRDLPVHWRFREVDDYWDVVTEISPSVGGAVATLDDARIGEVKRDFAERCEPFRDVDGYDLPGLSIGLLAR